MVFTGEVEAALIAAAGALLLAASTTLWKLVAHRRERRRHALVHYLYPLELALDDLLERWRRIARDIEAGKGVQRMAEFRRIAPSVHQPDFYRMCNGSLCGPVGTLLATASFFALAAKLRRDLPLVAIGREDATALLRHLDDARAGLASGDECGFWAELQDNIAQAVTSRDGAGVLGFQAFCAALAEARGSFDRLYEFYENIELKYPYQLKQAYPPLASALGVLRRLLATPLGRPQPQPTWRGVEAEGPRQPTVAA